MKSITTNIFKKLFASVAFILFIGLTSVIAQCTLPSGVTTIGNLASVCSPNTSGTLTIPNGATLDLNNAGAIFPAGFTEIIVENGGLIVVGVDYEFPSTLLLIELLDSDLGGPLPSGRIDFSGNNFLIISTATTLSIENTVTSYNTAGAALSGPGNQATRIYIGTQPYAAANNPNGAGVCFSFDQVIQNGGTPQLDGEVSIGAIGGVGNNVCLNTQPFTLGATISGNIPFTQPANFTWSQLSGPLPVATFGPNISPTPLNSTLNEVTVSNPGTYVFRVTVVQNLSVAGCNVTSTITLINDITVNILPSVIGEIVSTPDSNCGLTIDFSGSTNDPYPGGNPVTYLWDFGDGSPTSTDQNPTHTYASTGNFTVTLTVEDTDGPITACNNDTVTETVNVTDLDAPTFDCSSLTQIDFNSDSDTVCENNTDVTAPVAVDNCDGNITAVGTRSDNAAIDAPWPVGTTTITWTFTDSATVPNVTTCTQNVVVTDNQAPVFDCTSLTQIDFNSDSDTVCENNTDVTAPVAVDNCDGNITAVGTRSDNAAIDAPWPVGTTTITWTFTDSATVPNVTTCTQNVVVTDNQAPVFDCTSLTQIDFNSDSDTVCENNTDVTAPVAVDNCDGNITAVGTRSDNAAIDAPWPVGTTTITWTFTDSATVPNVTTCTQNVVVTDNQAPVFDCTSLTQIDFNSDSDTVCENNTDVTAPVAVDNCDGNITAVGTRSDNAAIDAPWPVGTTTITWTFTDSATVPNVTTCTQNVVVTDNQAPVFDCTSLTQIDFNSDSDTVCENNTDVTAPVAVDNCDGNITAVGTRSDNAAIDAPWPVGTTTITWTFTDSATVPNVTTCTQNVVVTDNQAPVFDCTSLTQIDFNSDSDTVCENNTDVTAPVAVDNCDGNITAVGTRSDNAAIDAPWPVGTTTITWTFTDSATVPNVTTCTQNVVVTDNQAPVFDCASLTQIDFNSDSDTVCENNTDVTAPVAVDNCDGNITAVGTRSDNAAIDAPWPVGTTTITWTFTDSATVPNVTTCTQNVVVTDNQAPVFDCTSLTQIDFNSDSDTVCENNTDVTAPVAVDNCDGNITAVGTRSDNAAIDAPWPVGTTTITWTFTDSATVPNVTTCTQNVVVTDNQAPVFDCTSLTQIDFNSDSDTVCENNTDVTAPVAVDNCDGNITAVGTRSDNAAIDAPWPVGTTTITWTFTDSATVPNVTTCTQNVVVTDNQAPVFDCTSLTQIDFNSDSDTVCENNTDVTAPVAVDNCDGNITAVGTRSDNAAIDAPWPVGTTTITWTFTDSATVPNVTTCTQNVVVTDNQAPVFDCTSLTQIDFNSDSDTVCENNTDVTAPVAVDNCDGNITAVGTRSDNAAIDAPWPVGTTTITWTFTDSATVPNVTTCTQNVVVTDNQAPVFDCASLTQIDFNSDSDTVCENNTDVTAPVAVDNCDGNITAVGTRSDNAAIDAPWPVGTTTITWTFTDSATVPNVTTCTQNVVVTDNQAPVFDCTSLTQIDFNSDSDTVCENNTDVTAPVAVDNCDGNITAVGTRSDNAAIDAPWPVGTTTITWTFTDSATVPNVTTCTQNVVVTDNQAPVFDCTSLTQIDFNSDSDTVCENNTDVTAPVAVDNCDGNITAVGTRSDNAAIDAPWPVGTTTITWTFTDSATVPNVTTCTQNVVVTDNQAPVFDCASLTQIDFNSDSDTVCENNTDVTAPVAVDNCDGNITAVGTRSDNAAIDAPWPVGTTTITWTFTDSATVPNVTTCTQNVVVTDNQAPITPTLSDVIGQCSATATTPTTEDNCSGIINGTTNDPLTYTTQGTFIITWTFDDGNGNVINVPQNVIVDDTTNPVAPILNDLTDECTVTATAPTIVDNCNGAIITGTTNDPLTYSTQGTFVITWTFDDGNGNVITAPQTVIINDITIPILSGQGVDANVECPDDFVFTAPTATDNCTLDNEIVITFEDLTTSDDCGLISTTRTWTATDIAGNTSITVSQTLTYIDTTAPVLSGQGADANVECPEDLLFTAPTASDSCSASNAEPVITFEDTETADNCGLVATTRTWTATDCSGNVSETVSQTLTYIDTTAPVLSGQGADANVECPEDLVFTAPTASDSCSASNTEPVITFEDTETADSCGLVATTRTWTATDCSGNVSETVSQTLTYIDTTAPVLSGQGADANVECPEDLVFTAPTASDSCSASNTEPVITFEDTETADSCGLVATTRTWTATDCSGNVSETVSQTLTYIDTTAPVLSGQGADANVECPEDLVFTAPTASDSCSASNAEPVITFEDTETADSCGLVATTRTWTATDCSGNVSETVSQTLTYIDTTAPVLSGQGADANVECPEDLVFTAPTASDSCSASNTEPVITFEDTETADSCGLVATTRTWTATDCSGNVSETVSQTLTYIDTTAPVLSGQGADANVECPEDLVFTAPTASDSCSASNTEPVITFEDTETADSCGLVATTRTWTATDCSGNVSETVSQTLTYIDTTAPVLSGQGADANVECPEDLVFTAPTASDSCSASNAEPVITFEDTETADSCGLVATTRTWTATDCSGNVSETVSQTLTYIDTTAPVLSGQGADANVECPEDLVFTAPTASDSCSASNTEPVITFEDTETADSCGLVATTRTWTATDCSGNVSETVSQTLTYIDTTAPVLSGQGADANVECPEDLVFTAPTASDSCSASNTEPVITFEDTETADSCGLVATTRTWTATDCSGNVSETVSQTLTYIDTTAPVLSGQGADANVECPEDLVFTAPTASDSCSASNAEPVITFEDTETADSCGLVATTRTWTATDCSGNVSETVSQTLTYIDTTAPVLSGQGADANVECPEDLVFTAPTASDSCSASNTEPVITFEDTETADSCGLVATTRTWTATDCSGNVSETVSQTLTYIDTTAPVLSGQGADANVECPEDLVFTAPTASDSCSASNTEPVITFEDTETADSCGLVATTRTWTATDCSGNVSETVSQTLTYIDTTAPVLSGQGADANVECPEDLVFTAPTASDSCSASNAEPVITFEDTETIGDCGLPVVTRTWTATDCAGNISESVSQTLTYVDTTPPELITPFDTNINVTCDSVPGVPVLEFTDTCTDDITVTFVESSTQTSNNSDFVITRTWTVSDGCNEVTFIQVINVSLPNISSTNDNICIGDDVNLDLFNYLNSDVDTTGTWTVTFGNATIDGSIFNPTTVANNDGDNNPNTFNEEDLGDYIFTYTLDDECLTTVDVTITLNGDCIVLACGREDVEISDTVTANGDGINEFFEVTGIENCGFVTDIQIFNRWGAVVYKSSNYQNDWSGQAISSAAGNANTVPTGTYYYVVTLRNSGFEPLAGPIYMVTGN